ncbi:MAG TPA: phosphonate ABC transporter ATP-binding protein [Burkholderiales bacterium]|nr:phosphonate ABC transporter ATP-binding protein [Burkholderiales bacterium]
MTACISIAGLNKSFHGSKALEDVNLSIAPGEMVALIGASGSGKSTLLRHIAGLACGDVDSRGAIDVFGRTVQCGGGLARYIRDIRSQIGFVFQQFNLIDRLSVITNVLAGMLYRVPSWRSTFRRFTRDEIMEGIHALARVGMEKRARQRASTLSGGQQQRAAIARTLVQQAKVILADEPIASLDPESSRRVMEILATINREDKTTIMVSLHQVDIALRYCPRTVALNHGHVVYDGASASLTPTLLRELYGAEADALFLPTLPEASATWRYHDRPAARTALVASRPAYAAEGRA